MSSNRGVLYIVWGDKIEPMLQRSMASVKNIHPELPIEVIRCSDDRAFYALEQKSSMFSLSPFEETLFLDADTIVFDRLDYGFEKAAQFGLACCICENPWARRYEVFKSKHDMVEYNTGVLFFSGAAQPIFDAWAKLAPELDSTLYLTKDDQLARMPYNDQCSFAAAVEEAGISPFILPLNWNFRAEFTESFFGPIKIFHSYLDPPGDLAKLNAQYRSDETVIGQHRIKQRT